MHNAEADELQAGIKVDVIQLQKRHWTRESASTLLVLAQVDFVELLHHQFRGEASCPFVEVSQDHTWTCVGGMVQHLFAQQQRSLCPAFDVAGAQMHIKDMQQPSFLQVEVSPKTSARLAPPPADVVIFAALNC